ncbi:MAG: nicotinate-nicotinamide nucleotide adenylyltransferase [Deltaproteobacteria bacterium]|nr:nicotinate-nicotinamide nucleotide adenylyltransferase [Deltaproteobacteria bacterium]
MRVAVFGGSFNPPHVGHAMVAAWVRWVDLADAAWLVPAYQHAFDKALVPFDRRLAACEALCARLGPDFLACDIESRLPTPSYTINTLRALRERHPGLSFRLLLGADNLAAVHKWRAWPTIEAEFSPIIVGRGNAGPDGAPRFPDISSTDIRRRVTEGLPVDHLVPRDVLDAWQR